MFECVCLLSLYLYACGEMRLVMVSSFFIFIIIIIIIYTYDLLLILCHRICLFILFYIYTLGLWGTKLLHEHLFVYWLMYFGIKVQKFGKQRLYVPGHVFSSVFKSALRWERIMCWRVWLHYIEHLILFIDWLIHVLGISPTEDENMISCSRAGLFAFKKCEQVMI